MTWCPFWRCTRLCFQHLCSYNVISELLYWSLILLPWRCLSSYIWGRDGGDYPHPLLLQLVTGHQTKMLLMTNSWPATGPPNDCRDGVVVFAEHGDRMPKSWRSFRVFVWGSQFCQRSSPSRAPDLKDLSRASTAFTNKLVGEMILYSTAVDHCKWRSWVGAFPTELRIYKSALSAFVNVLFTLG